MRRPRFAFLPILLLLVLLGTAAGMTTDQAVNCAAHRAGRALFVTATDMGGNYSGDSWTNAVYGTAANLKTAVETTATAGTVVLLGAGTYALVDTYIEVPPAVQLVGAGMYATIITSTHAFGDSGHAIIRPGSGSLISTLTVQATAAAGDYQTPIGTSGSNNQAAFTNAVIFQVRIIGDADGFFAYHATACSARLEECVIQTKYDAVTTSSPSGTPDHRIDIYRSTIQALGPSSCASGATAEALVSAAGRIRAFECNILASGGVNNNYGVRAMTGGECEIHRCHIWIDGPTGTGKKLYVLYQSGTGTLYVDQYTWYVISPANRSPSRFSGTIKYTLPSQDFMDFNGKFTWGEYEALLRVDLAAINDVLLNENNTGGLAASFMKWGDVATPSATAASQDQTGDSYSGVTIIKATTDALAAANYYTAQINLTRVTTGAPLDRYDCEWLKNAVLLTSGISNVGLHVRKRDNTDLIGTAGSPVTMTQVGATGAFKYDTTTSGQRLTAGEAALATVTATIDGATRTWRRWVGRDK